VLRRENGLWHVIKSIEFKDKCSKEDTISTLEPAHRLVKNLWNLDIKNDKKARGKIIDFMNTIF
jgi:hypothetical protein